MLQQLAVVLATTRPNEATAFLTSLFASGTPGAVIVVFQGSSTDYLQLAERASGIASRAAFKNLQLIYDAGCGCSQGRNVGLAATSPGQSWVWFPNDTTRASKSALAQMGQDVTEAHDNVGAIAGRYAVDGQRVRPFTTDFHLEGWDLFSEPAEPAIVWRVDAVRTAGGFDERLGTGGPSLAQSMEGADLLIRLDGNGWLTMPSSTIVSASRLHTPADRKAAREKSWFYGVGYGVVARRHGLLVQASTHALSPLARWCRDASKHRMTRPLSDALAITFGRVTGLLLGEVAVRTSVASVPGSHGSRDWLGRIPEGSSLDDVDAAGDG